MVPTFQITFKLESSYLTQQLTFINQTNYKKVLQTDHRFAVVKIKSVNFIILFYLEKATQ